MRKGVQIYFACAYPTVSAQFVEKTILFLLDFLGTFVKNQLTIDVYLGALNSIPLIFTESHCLDYCRFAVSFEAVKCEFSNLFFFSRIVLAILGPCNSIWILRPGCQFLPPQNVGILKTESYNGGFRAWGRINGELLFNRYENSSFIRW